MNYSENKEKDRTIPKISVEVVRQEQQYSQRCV